MVFWLNAFPVKTGISGVYSPQELLVRWHLDYNKHCRVLPGTYCEVHDEPVPSNTMTSRTHAVTAMRPTGNLHGSVKFYCLTTGRILKSGDTMTQYNFKLGLRKFGAKGQSAAIDELTQLHVMDTWTAMEATKLSREDKMKALSSLLFLKEKQMGKIKGRACINGAPQQAYIPKEDAALPTVSTESTFVTVAIAANEKRKVRCFNIPSPFMNTDVDEDVLMVLKGELHLRYTGSTLPLTEKEHPFST